MRTAIRVEGLGKRYRIGHAKEAYRTLRDTLANAALAPIRRVRNFGRASYREEDTIWALRDISFEVPEGEVLGVIGANGAGKSTLLKILTRITEPTEGMAELTGRVGSLLEVGTGFHQELTGRENVFLSGAILGMEKREVARKFGQIVEFSEIGKYIDTPVKRYSSGMRVRLGFSVAAHLEPEILLIDEVLAVGDVAFQRKCWGAMENVSSGGRTILLVSHNMNSVQRLCQRALLLREGRLTMIGPVDEVVDAYLAGAQQDGSTDLAQRTDRSGDGRLQFDRLWFADAAGEPVSTVRSGQAMDIVMEYRCEDGAEFPRGLHVAATFSNSSGQRVFTVSSRVTGHALKPTAPQGRWVCSISELPLMPDRYVVTSLWCGSSNQAYDHVRNAAALDVIEGDFFGTGQLPKRKKSGILLVHQRWADCE